MPLEKPNRQMVPLSLNPAIPYTPVDMGATPPYNSAGIHPEESAIRSTLPNKSVSPKREQARDANVGDYRSTTAVDGDEIPGPAARGMDRVDTTTDQHYMVNQAASSWSGTLASEDDSARQAEIDINAQLAMVHVRKAQQMAEKNQQIREAQAAHEEKKAKNEKLRSTLKSLKGELRDGAKAALVRPQFTARSPHPECSHPYCSANLRQIPHCVAIAENGQLASAIYCLTCFEGLINGEGMCGELPELRVVANVSEEKDPTMFKFTLEEEEDPTMFKFTLDGSVDVPSFTAINVKPLSEMNRKCSIMQQLAGNEAPDEPAQTSPPSQSISPAISGLLASMHAPNVELLSTHPPNTPSPLSLLPPFQVPETLGGSPLPSLGSMMSDGQERKPPTRLQHLAKFILPTDTLSKAEGAAVCLWILASKDQLRWANLRRDNEDCVEQYRRDSAYAHDGDSEMPRGAAGDEEGEIGESEQQLAENAGLTTMECHGLDLTDVMALIGGI